MIQNQTNIKFSQCRILLIQLIDGKDWTAPIEYIHGEISTIIGRDFHLKFPDLHKGKYYLYIEMDWH